jgi:hypothetical protein
MADDDPFIRVKSMFSGASLRYQEKLAPSQRAGDENKGKQQPGKRDVAAYFRTIQKAAETLNEILIKKAAPYRFRVYREGDQILIELMVMDKNGVVTQENKKNITHDDFARLIEDIASGEGLVIDSLG